MDKVTQQNAANAEESASASEELSAQAESMKEVVDQLVALVGGAGSKTTNSNGHRVHMGIEHKLHPVSKATSKPRGFGKSDEVLHKIAGHAEKPHTAAKSAGTAIPLDNDDLTEFNS
jgi:methyl-accepting chemotaxis protein